MKEKMVVRESVRGIVEYVMKSGSLDNRFMSTGRAVEGTIAHGKLQSDNEKTYKNYEKEVKMECVFSIDDIDLIIEGRCDGIIIDNNTIIIEEIKSTYKNLLYIEENYNELHWAQGKFYGYMYCVKNNINNIDVRLSYYNLNSNEVKSFQKEYSFEELDKFINGLIKNYVRSLNIKRELIDRRNKSIEETKFPFNSYRIGQRELAVSCYNTIKEKEVLFAQAPTGIGKTISTIFPAIKSMGNKWGNRIIYLTSKNITRVVAEEAYKMLLEKGLKYKVLSLTAKEKVCLNDSVKCNEDECEYAKDYFSKINLVIEELIQNEDLLTREVIIKYSEKYKVCPFELSLDLASWCDCIICDYNYAFDPRVRLKRIFEEENEHNILLVDEAHNLVDRARNMYSGEIYKSTVMNVKKLLKGRVPKLYKISNLINKELIEIRRELEENNLRIIYKNTEYKELIKLMKIFISEADEYLIKGSGTSGYEEILDFYYQCRTFVSLNELYSKNYTTIIEKINKDFKVKIFCINPAENLKKIIKSSYASILFSATLSPMKYYIDLLGGDEQCYRLRLPSPFKKENLETLIAPVDMRYTKREENIFILCKIIKEFINTNRGNYIVFLPSFEYLKAVSNKFVEVYGEEKVIIQQEQVTEMEKEEFLSNFTDNSEVLAFAVVGGMFSEGVDLPGNKLIGAIIVGVGFPMISIENDIISEFFKENGFDYAYTYPGINKVLQCAGRVIRTETDKGRVLLVDRRYLSNKYKNLLPKDWNLKLWKNIYKSGGEVW